MGNNGTGVEIQELLRDILRFLEEIVQGDVESFNRKIALIEDIKKKYPWIRKKNEIT